MTLDVFWAAIGSVIGPGIGAAVAPMSIVAVLMILSIPKSRIKALYFLVGNLVAFGALSLILLAVAFGADVSEPGTRSRAASAVALLVGIFFLGLALLQWRARPKPGKSARTPGWLASIEDANNFGALRLGGLLGLVNAKNFSLAVTVAASVAQTGVSTRGGVTAVLVFAVLSVLGVSLPILALQFGPAEIGEKLVSLRGYLVENNAIILTVVFALLGANSIGKALGPLFQ